jgi:hypothetical protein
MCVSVELSVVTSTETTFAPASLGREKTAICNSPVFCPASSFITVTTIISLLYPSPPYLPFRYLPSIPSHSPASCLLGQDISPAGRPAEQRQARSHATSRSESNTPRIPSSASSFPTASLPGSENIHCQLTRSLCLPSHTLLSLGTSSPEFLLRSQSITTHQYAAFNTHSRYSRNRLPWRQRYQPETFRQRGATRDPTPHPTPRRHHKSYTTRPQSSPQEAVIGQERSRRA